MSGDDALDRIRWAEADEWLAKADEDLGAASVLIAASTLIAGRPSFIDVAAYHCQQTIEKQLKALLVVSAIAPPKTHDMARLIDLTAPCFPVLAPAMTMFAGLTSWGVATRYPEFESADHLALSDVVQAIAAIEAFRDAIRALPRPTERGDC